MSQCRSYLHLDKVKESWQQCFLNKRIDESINDARYQEYLRRVDELIVRGPDYGEL